MNNKKLNSCFALILLITGAIDSIRNLPTTALFGASLIFYCIIAAILFLVPIAIVTARLSREYPDEGGIYQWIRMSFGRPVAVIGIWLQWVNTLIWYPTILVFISATLAYLINPALAQNKSYLIFTIVIIFWIMSFLNLFGVRMSGFIASFCAIVGVFIPLVFIVGFAIFWLVTGHPNQISTHANWLPKSFSMHNVVALTAIITSFLGIELATVHHRDIEHSDQMFPRALFISVILIIATMILGSLAIAFVIPSDHISLISGVMQAFNQFFASIKAPWMNYVLSILIIIGGLGGLVNWIISPSKGVLQAARDGYLPKFLTIENKYNVPMLIIFIQAIVVTLLAMVYLFVPNNSAYWLLTDLSTELYVAMYALLLAAAIYLNYQEIHRISMYIWGSIGIIGCIIALIVGFMSPTQITYPINYQILFGICLILMLIPAGIAIAYKLIFNKDDIN